MEFIDRRDEQRAWYDTLRDLVPSIMGLQPTVRLYASDQVWCSLDPDFDMWNAIPARVHWRIPR